MRDGDQSVIESALTSPDFPIRQHEVHATLREAAPVYWSPSLNQWLVTSYDLVHEVLSDPGRFSSVGAEIRHVDSLGPVGEPDVATVRDHFAAPQLNITDPPDHTRIRRAFGRSFLPRAVDRYEDLITSITDRLLAEAVSDDGSIDIVSRIAEPLPVMVISAIIGIPPADRAQIRRVTLDQRYFFGSAAPGPEQARRFAESLREWHSLLTDLMEQRRLKPTDDVLTRAVQKVDDGALTMNEAVATCLHLIIAGNSTTTALIGNTVFALLSHPDQLERILADPDLIPNAVEESLRFEAPLPRDRRTATIECELGGQTIRAGDHVACVLAAANRDPAEFDRPNEFDVGRTFTKRQHASFGIGIHFCLGAPLARLETSIAIRKLLEHLREPILEPGFQPQWHEVATHRGLVEVPIRSEGVISEA